MAHAQHVGVFLDKLPLHTLGCAEGDRYLTKLPAVSNASGKPAGHIRCDIQGALADENPSYHSEVLIYPPHFQLHCMANEFETPSLLTAGSKRSHG